MLASTLKIKFSVMFTKGSRVTRSVTLLNILIKNMFLLEKKDYFFSGAKNLNAYFVK